MARGNRLTARQKRKAEERLERHPVGQAEWWNANPKVGHPIKCDGCGKTYTEGQTVFACSCGSTVATYA